MDPKEKLKKALERAQELQKASAERDLTDDELIEVKNLNDEIPALRTQVEETDAKAKAIEDGKALLKRLGEAGKRIDDRGEVDEQPAKSLGEHFVKSPAYAKAKDSKGGRYGVSAPEFIPSKAAGDPTVSTDLTRPEYGPVVQLPLRRPTVAQLLSQGTLTNSSLTYYVQQAMAGDFDQVAENAQKPGMTFSFEPTTSALHKIAGWYKISDEALEDSEYVVSVINNQLLVRLALAEEDALLNSTGAGKLTGILQTSGIQTEAAASDTDQLPALLRALTKVQTGAEIVADGIVINPVDYQNLRLQQDANQQFYGGGPFTGAYGNGGLPGQPDIWSYRTVVTQAIAQGTALVGNFQVGAQLFRKGGVRVDSTNSDGTDFQYNRTMVRAEERVLLAVYQPLAFVSVDLTSGS